MTGNRDVLVVGGGGYIGQHLVRRLCASGRQITVLDRRPVVPDLTAGVEYVQGDYAERDLLIKLLDRHQDVIHLAYATVPNTSFQDPLADLLQNLPPMVQLFAEAAARGNRVLFVSSGGTVYGASDRIPICEAHPTKPVSPYGVTKLTQEHYAHLYAATHGLKFICVRPGNAYGEGQQPFTGQGFIPTAMASAMKGLPIKMFGENGTVRDYIFITDLTEGICCALERGGLSETYNIGTGTGRSNREIIDVLRPLMKEIDCNIIVENLPERVFDVKANVLDSTKLREHTGWEPQVDFAEGLIRTRDWLRSFYA